jgi:hypothetical protein
MIFPGRIPSSGRSKAKTLLVAATLCAALGQATAQDSIERLPLDQQVEQGDDLPAIDVPPLPGEGQPAPDQAQPAPAETQAAPKVAAPPQRIKNAVAEFAGVDKITGPHHHLRRLCRRDRAVRRAAGDAARLLFAGR